MLKTLGGFFGAELGWTASSGMFIQFTDF